VRIVQPFIQEANMKRILILAIGLLPSALFARDSIIPQYVADAGSSMNSAEYWSAHSRGGYLTREQATQYGVRDFAHIDNDTDGRVSQAEWNAWHNAQKNNTRSQPVFSDAEWNRYDRNRDGVITKREAAEMDPRTWAHANLNADGKISKKEWQAIAANARTPNLSAWQRADRDNDGFVTRTEGLALDTATFTNADTDGDGKLSQGEWDAFDPQVGGVAGRAAPLFPDAR
jgi:Ca2+-binding EF-hand superfamily protein